MSDSRAEEIVIITDAIEKGMKGSVHSDAKCVTLLPDLVNNGIPRN